LTALNQTTTPLVLTSRSEEYHAAVAASAVLTAAAVITVADLTLADVTAYLSSANPPDTRAGARWAPVLASLTAAPPAPAAATVAAALATPLTVYLARVVYSDALQHNPAELLDGSRLPTAEAIEEHLLGAFVPAVYRQPDPTQTSHPRRRPWDDADDAHRWHTSLATHLHRRDTQDLAWWRLRDAVPRTVRVLTFTLVYGPIIGLLFGGQYGLVAGIAFGIALGPVGALGIDANEPQPLSTRFQLRRKARKPQPQWTQSRLRALVLKLLKVLARRAIRLPAALVVGITAGLAFGIALGLVVGLVFGITGWFANEFVARLVSGFWLGFISGFGLGFSSGVTTVLIPEASEARAVEADTVLSPVDLLHINRKQLIGFAVGSGLVLWLMSVAFGLVGGRTIPDAITFAAPLPVFFPVFLVPLSAWGRWLIFTRLWLPATGKLPWPVMGFLVDAHRRGVLRQAGGVYQYRHARLRDRLATRSSSP